MSKLKESIAAAIVIVVLPNLAGAQAAAARTDVPKAVPAKQADPVANSSGSPNQLSPVPRGSEARAPYEVNAPNGAGQASSGAPPAAAAHEASAEPPQAPPPTAAYPGAVVARGGEGTVQQVDSASGVEGPRASSTTGPAKTFSYRCIATVDVANVLWRSGRGNDLFSENAASWRLGIGIGYDLLQLPEHLILALEAGYLGEPAHGGNLNPIAGSLQGSLSASTVLLGTSLRWSITPWMAPYARLGLLASRMSMDIDTNSGASGSSAPESWSHHKWTEGALMGAGLMMNLLPQARFNFGLLLEGGLWLQRDVAMELTRELPNGALATSGARVGTLENTGPYFRLAGVLRF
jgi:hypothetical protein